jgi:DNA-binding transcriptional MerR regulator
MAQTQISFSFDDEPLDKKPAVKKQPAKKLMPPPPENIIAKKEKSNRGRKSLKGDWNNAAIIEVPEDDVLFLKSYYSISEVAAMFKENISQIRLYENEFDILKPKRNGKGDRLFRPEDVKNLKLIHHLLRERKYTMQGAKDFLKKKDKAQEIFETIENLKKIKNFLHELKANL